MVKKNRWTRESFSQINPNNKSQKISHHHQKKKKKQETISCKRICAMRSNVSRAPVNSLAQRCYDITNECDSFHSFYNVTPLLTTRIKKKSLKSTSNFSFFMFNKSLLIKFVRVGNDLLCRFELKARYAKMMSR